MKINKNNIKILLVLALLILIPVLFISFIAEKDIGIISVRWTSTPEPMRDIFPARCEIVLEVLKDDTLNAIAYNFDISKENIVQYNHLESNEISPGMILLIPMCKPMRTPTVTPAK